MNLEVLKSAGAIKKVATKTFGRSALVVQKYSPQILTTVGVVGVVASGVLASKATLRLEDIVDRGQADLEEVEAKSHTLSADKYSSTAHKRDLTRVYISTSMDVVKLYGPAVTLGVASIGCLLGAQGIMHKRNVALVAAYKGLEESFNKYRNRVVEEFGPEKDFDYVNGFKTEKIKDENGKTKTVTVVDPNGISPYSRFFDELSSAWSKTPEYNLMWIRSQQNMANDLLHARGHVFLNDVYDSLGIPRSQEGAVVGWVMGHGGDEFVDFGIYDFDSQKARDFVNGFEKAILLNFNVDGVIWDKI